MGKNILITGGAGFIGSHLANELLNYGYRVRVLDNLCPQVHGAARKRPAYLNPDVELQVGDVRDASAVHRALEGIDAVYHFVAVVGVGQSMYEIADYTSVNNLGTAVLLEGVLKQKNIQRMVVASSMSIYGEGLYQDSKGRICAAADRTFATDQGAGLGSPERRRGNVDPIPTPETKTPTLGVGLRSFQIRSGADVSDDRSGLSDSDRCAAILQHLRSESGLIQSVYRCVGDLRFRLLNNRAPLINEDGKQKRDFVSVYDVARACRLALETKEAAGGVSISRSGNQYTSQRTGRQDCTCPRQRHRARRSPAKYRAGDIRHCFADITKAREVLGFEPCVSLEDGLADLASWLEGQIASDRVAESRSELAARGLDGMSDLVLICGGAGFIGTNLGIQVARGGHSRAGV